MSAAVLDTLAPRGSVAQAEGFVRQHFGLSCRAEPLFSERDQHFRMAASDGRHFVFRIANAAEAQATTDLQTAALMHIAREDPGLPVPRVIPTLDGRAEARIVLDGTAHFARLLTFVEGTPFLQLRLSPEQRGRLGGSLARLGLALRGFSHPAADHALPWDLRQAEGVRGYVEAVADPACRTAARAVLDRFADHVVPILARLRMQAVHNDFSPHNVLVAAADPGQVSGILDFGDLVRTQLVNDVAIGACYQVDAERGALLGEADFVAGYHRAVALLPDELDVLFDLVKLRHVLTVSITEWRARRYPDNAAYILRNHARAAHALLTLDALPREAGTAVLRRACGL